MGKITIQPHTTLCPIEMIGEEAGICYGADTSDKGKNYDRGLDCIRSQHGRPIEFPTVYAVIDGHSAKMIRELYTHIGGAPTRLQASTRYIEYGEFEYVTPPSIQWNSKANELYQDTMMNISNAINELESVYKIPREDASMLLPLGMTTKVVWKVNARTLVDMSHQRECLRAWWEFREFFNEFKEELSNYSSQWKTFIDETFMPKCVYLKGCPEKKSCGYYDKWLKAQFQQMIDNK